MFESYDTPVRCSAGHRFTTIWVPLGSVKAVRLGWKRPRARRPDSVMRGRG